MKLKKNYILILFVIYLVAIPLFLLIGSFFLSSSTKKMPQVTPTSSTGAPTSTPAFQLPPTYSPVQSNDTTKHKQLVVVKTSPVNNQGDVPVDIKSITITFDQQVTVQDVPLAIAPDLPYKINAQGTSIIITPQAALQPGTVYFVVLRLYRSDGKIQLYTLSFKTTGATPTPLPNTRPPQSDIDQENQQQIQSAPDVYVSNQTPHNGGTFSVTSDYKSTPTGHFYFTVTLIGDPTTAKNDFINWLKSLGLNDSQISSLDVVYH